MYSTNNTDYKSMIKGYVKNMLDKSHKKIKD